MILDTLLLLSMVSNKMQFTHESFNNMNNYSSDYMASLGHVYMKPKQRAKYKYTIITKESSCWEREALEKINISQIKA